MNLRGLGLGPIRAAATIAGIVAVIIADRLHPPPPVHGYTTTQFHADNSD